MAELTTDAVIAFVRECSTTRAGPRTASPATPSSTPSTSTASTCPSCVAILEEHIGEPLDPELAGRLNTIADVTRLEPAKAGAST